MNRQITKFKIQLRMHFISNIETMFTVSAHVYSVAAVLLEHFTRPNPRHCLTKLSCEFPKSFSADMFCR